MSGVIYRGKSHDGSDAELVTGVATASPCGNYWTTEDLSKMTRSERRRYWRELKIKTFKKR